jgi:hypothetical protein
MHLADFMARRELDLVINLPMRSGARRVSTFSSHGYRTRRLAVDYAVPLVTDVKCAKLLVQVCYGHRTYAKNLIDFSFTIIFIKMLSKYSINKKY